MSTERLDICGLVPGPAAIASGRPEIPFLAVLGGEAADAIRAGMSSVAVAGGGALFEEEDEADALYTLVSGAVGLSTRPTAACAASSACPRRTP